MTATLDLPADLLDCAAPTDVREMFRAVYANPLCGDTRMVFADALQAAGYERAALRQRVIGQPWNDDWRMAYAGMLDDDGGREEWVQVVIEQKCKYPEQIPINWNADWIAGGPLPGITEYTQYATFNFSDVRDDSAYLVSRGFVSHVSMTHSEWLEHAGLFALHPLEEVGLRDVSCEHSLFWRALSGGVDNEVDRQIFEILCELDEAGVCDGVLHHSDTPEVAKQRLSQACIVLARRRAKLSTVLEDRV
jgi:hypothetical protein